MTPLRLKALVCAEDVENERDRQELEDEMDEHRA